MTTSRSNSASAIQMYTLTVAYLHDAPIDNLSHASALYAQEISPASFYIWYEGMPNRADRPDAPVAICTYMEKIKMWTVELLSGEVLTLIDKGKVWEIVKDDKEIEKRKIAKKVSAGVKA
jgi:hypothetical protein